MAILIGALALRIAEVQGTSYRPINDAGSYLTLASYIARTGDYSLRRTPGSGAGGTRGPSAYFAPGFPYFLGLVDIIDGHKTRRDGAIQPARISQAVLGTITVALIGLVAFEMFGEDAGLIALVLAAIYPVLIELSATIVAENLLTALVLAAVYTGLRVRRARNGRTPARVGGGDRRARRAGDAHPRERGPDPDPADPRGVDGPPAAKARSLAAPAVLIAVDRAHDPAVDDSQRGRHAPLHPGLRRDRNHARRHLQRRRRPPARNCNTSGGSSTAFRASAA